MVNILRGVFWLTVAVLRWLSMWLWHFLVSCFDVGLGYLQRLVNWLFEGLLKGW